MGKTKNKGIAGDAGAPEKLTREQVIAQATERVGIMSPEELKAAYIEAAGLLYDQEEDLATAESVIEKQNAAIEDLDKKSGTETGNFIEHKKQKIEVRLRKFKLQGKPYGIDDLKKNVTITVKGKDKDGNPTNEEVGITDYLLKIKSPVLEIEEKAK